MSPETYSSFLLRKVILYAVVILSTNILMAAPEMWVSGLDTTLPMRTPSGRITNSIGFVLRICGTNAEPEFVNIFDAVGFRARDATGNVITGSYERNTALLPQGSDIIMATPEIIRQQAYTCHLKEDKLIIPDRTGGIFAFGPIRSGTIYIEVVYDATNHVKDPEVIAFQDRKSGGGKFYIGPQKMW